MKYIDVSAATMRDAMDTLKNIGVNMYNAPHSGVYKINSVANLTNSGNWNRAYAPTSGYREQSAQTNMQRDAVICTGRLYLNGNFAGMYDYAYISGNQTLETYEYPRIEHWFTTNTDTHWALVCIDGTLTIENRVQIKPPTRKLGFVLHTDGNFVCDGIVSMTKRGANHSGTGNSHGYTAPVAIPVKSGITIPATGGAGGARVTKTTTGSAKNDGGTATNGSGGGGSGCCHPVVTVTSSSSGAGAAGTCFAGGAGGGSLMIFYAGTSGATQPGETMDAIANGGAGGNGCSDYGSYGHMGGSGNPAGAIRGAGTPATFTGWGGQTDNTNPTDWHYYGYGEDINIEDKRPVSGNSYYLSRPYSPIEGDFDGAAGTLMIFVNGTFSGTGKVISQGLGTGNFHDGVSGAGGGCAGGGIVCILDSGGSGGPSATVNGGAANNTYPGGAGGAGSSIRSTY